ncbi:DNA-binding protein [Microbacterium protaetiae]|uniref:DNA-binding protein n=1 Tax=Microbacterium protaetiae TaxID=2509458 RepID=A0A4P6EHD3_9MICO|nr:helix-turn-helix domain-containing protein [Microbacterium protaetiae]QAY60913.1 DNA-binding protein [Microbacterium protaetiae]
MITTATDEHRGSVPELLTTPEAAALLRVSPRTMEDWGRRGVAFAPHYVRVGGHRIVYRRDELLEWLDGRAA